MLLPGESQGQGSLVGCHLWVAQSRTQLKRLSSSSIYETLEEEMTAHSSILAWRIPWAEEPGGYSPWGHKESDMTEVT